MAGKKRRRRKRPGKVEATPDPLSPVWAVVASVLAGSTALVGPLAAALGTLRFDGAEWHELPGLLPRAWQACANVCAARPCVSVLGLGGGVLLASLTAAAFAARVAQRSDSAPDGRWGRRWAVVGLIAVVVGPPVVGFLLGMVVPRFLS